MYFVNDVREGAGQRPFDPAKDFGALREKAAAIQNVRLLVVDPIVSAVSGDSHKNAETRRGLAPLVDTASNLGAALLGITHFRKGTAGREPVERITGSIAFGALARVVMIAAKEPDREDGTPGRRIFARAKSNIGPDEGGFAYRMDQVSMPGDDRILASIAVFGEAIQGTARQMLASAEAMPDAKDTDRSALREAKQFLSEALSSGAMSAKAVKDAANDAGLSWRTVERAKEALGAKTRKEGMKGSWVWSLAEDRLKDPNTAISNGLAVFADLGGLLADDGSVGH